MAPLPSPSPSLGGLKDFIAVPVLSGSVRVHLCLLRWGHDASAHRLLMFQSVPSTLPGLLRTTAMGTVLVSATYCWSCVQSREAACLAVPH